METLKPTWLTDGWIDFEYKKYMLLAYLKKASEAFGRVELYPTLSDLIFHYRNLLQLKENKRLLASSFPKELTSTGIKTLELTYKRMVEDDDLMKELESILEYSIPRIKSSVEEGSEVYEQIESHCEILPVGLIPLYTHAGYMFIAQPPAADTDIYAYQITMFDHDNSRGLHTRFLTRETRSLSNTYERMKMELVRSFTDMPNPCVYVVESKLKVPQEPTLLPIAKRLLIKHLAKEA